MTRQENATKLEGKAAKILGKSKHIEGIHIYKINSEVLLGFLPSPSRSPKNSERDEETLSTGSQCSDETDGLSFATPLSDDVLTKPSPSPTPSPSPAPNDKRFKRQMLVIPDKVPDDKGTHRNGIIFPESSFQEYLSFCSSPDSGVNVDYTPSPSLNKMKQLQSMKVSSSPSLLDHTTYPPLATS